MSTKKKGQKSRKIKQQNKRNGDQNYFILNIKDPMEKL